MDKNLKPLPRADKKFEKWDPKSVEPLSPSLRGDPWVFEIAIMQIIRIFGACKYAIKDVLPAKDDPRCPYQ